MAMKVLQLLLVSLHVETTSQLEEVIQLLWYGKVILKKMIKSLLKISVLKLENNLEEFHQLDLKRHQVLQEKQDQS